MFNKFKCPKCKAVNSAKDWNDATIDEYGTEIGFIQGDSGDCLFVCPSCKEDEIIGDSIEGVE
jgi:predicted RNA-binding Zn-ribbon protein involved in translation (DUF1610 family)